MTTFEQLRETVRSTGLWDGTQALSHGFLLSPEVHCLSVDNQHVLNAFVPALRSALSGIGQIATIADQRRIAGGRTWARVRRILSVGVPITHRRISLLRPATGPALCKVDFMRAADGSLRIAEIDGHNKHGMGYSTLSTKLRQAISPTAKSYAGVADALAQEVKNLQAEQVVLLVAEQERFYLPEFAIIARAVATKGIRMIIVRESDTAAIKKHILDPAQHERVLLVDFPFLFHNYGLNTLLAKAYADRQIDFLFLPKPFLGSKGLLALLRNEEADPGLETILRSHIHADSLACLRALIPRTYFVGKAATSGYWKELAAQDGWVIKDTLSCGMKGTAFVGDKAFPAILKRAATSYDRSVLQQLVDTKPHQLRFFHANGTPDESTWYLRLTVHVTRLAIADVTVTARRDRAVHGAKDCLVLGTVLA